MVKFWWSGVCVYVLMCVCVCVCVCVYQSTALAFVPETMFEYHKQ